MRIYYSILLLTFGSLLFSCDDADFIKKTTQAETLFSLVPDAQTHISFVNSVKQDFDFNYTDYPYAFTGGGVATGDINNDGLDDVYLVSNQKSNKLYLNKGNFEFEDITEIAGVSDTQGWSTGVTMVDINNDGWLDIYVCKSASIKDNDLRRNKLFINQKNGTFREEAKKWGLDLNGFSIQSYFFDYDKDGDLDMYLVNHRPDFKNANKLENKLKREYFPELSDHLLRNDRGKFTNVTLQSGIINKEWGLSASIGDFNNDGWPDIFVANDYIGPDYLYINNKKGKFINEIDTRFKHISYNSMGSDYADINNDLLPDLIVLDMLAEDHQRGKENMPSMNTKGFWMMVDAGYHYSYMSNVLQLNNGNGTFSDIGQLAGISKTDWSWAPLIADFDNDGYKDILVTNGIERELGNQDYKQKVRELQSKQGAMTVNEMMQVMPSEKLSNYIFQNKGDLTFENKTEAWGLQQKLNSNGVAYADLDNDGDLDLVMNNSSDNASVYRNNSTGNYITIKLVGDSLNKNAIGAKVRLFTDKTAQYQELYPSRGYQSAVSKTLNFGIGDEENIKRIEIIWGDDTVLAQEDVKANQTITFKKAEFKYDGLTNPKIIKYFEPIPASSLGITYKHNESDFNDFSKQVLLPQKKSQQGPTMAVADVNGDGLDDIFLGGGLGQSAALYLQNNRGKFDLTKQPVFDKDKNYEDQGSLFLDVDNDGDLDLYLASGSYELSDNDPLLQDRLYLNEGKGSFIASNALPKMLTSTKSIQALDYDNDGDLDIAVGGNLVPGKYPLAPKSYILENNKGHFTDVTQKIAPELTEIGLINDMIFSDYDNDGDKDLIVVGEWFPITIFDNNNGYFNKKIHPELANSSGWWNTIKEIDLNEDGHMDYLIGNLGENNKFHPTIEKPLHIYGNNFDENESYDMFLSKVYKGKLVPVRGKECSTEQNPFVSEKIPTFKEFAASTIIDIYGESEINASYHKEVYTFSSSIAMNNGDGTFTLNRLPTTAQIGPTLAFEIVDINHDGLKDVIGIGDFYEAEVETIRYDSNTGYVLLANKDGNLIDAQDKSFFNYQNNRSLKQIKLKEDSYLIVANNDAALSVFKVK